MKRNRHANLNGFAKHRKCKEICAISGEPNVRQTGKYARKMRKIFNMGKSRRKTRSKIWDISYIPGGKNRVSSHSIFGHDDACGATWQFDAPDLFAVDRFFVLYGDIHETIQYFPRNFPRVFPTACVLVFLCESPNYRRHHARLNRRVRLQSDI